MKRAGLQELWNCPLKRFVEQCWVSWLLEQSVGCDLGSGGRGTGCPYLVCLWWVRSGAPQGQHVVPRSAWEWSLTLCWVGAAEPQAGSLLWCPPLGLLYCCVLSAAQGVRVCGGGPCSPPSKTQIKHEVWSWLLPFIHFFLWYCV